MKTGTLMATTVAAFLGLAALLAVPAPVWAQWTQAGNDLYTTNLNSEVGIGLTAPLRQLHVQGNNAAFRLDRDVNSTGFMLVRTKAGDFNTIWKSFVFGVKASGVNNGYFVIEDLGTAVGGDGARRLTITNNGWFGIGTTLPLSQLWVTQSDGGDINIGVSDNDGYTALFGINDSGNYAALSHGTIFDWHADTIVMKGGNVGIGTTNPARQLHVWNNSAAQLRLSSSSTEYADFYKGAAALEIASNGSTKMTIEDNGEVGIGTTAPSCNLHVYGAGTTTLKIQGNNTNDVRLQIQNGGPIHYLFDDYSDGHCLKLESASACDIAFNTNGANERMCITSAGNVGIGTTSPNRILQVVDDDSSSFITCIRNTNTGASADGLSVWLDAATPAAGNNWIQFLKGSGGWCAGSVKGNGAGGVTFDTSSCDFAEWLPRLKANEHIEAGDIVGVVAGKVTRDTAGAEQVQVISTAPIVLGNNPGEEKAHLYEKVAFLGQAPLKVRGAARAGDFILPSGLNDGTGVAVSPGEITSDRCGKIVGRALESSDRAEVKQVKAMVDVHSSGRAFQEMIVKKDTQIAQLAARLEALEKIVKETK